MKFYIKTNFICAFLILICSLWSFNFKAQQDIVEPKENTYISGDSILFSWNSEDTSILFDLEIATDSTFDFLVFDSLNIANNSLHISINSGNNLYFWRIKESTSLIYGDLFYRFNYRNPEQFQHLVAIFQSDIGIDTTGTVVNSWQDQKSGISAFQNNANNRPEFVDTISSLKNKGLVCFDGIAQSLQTNHNIEFGSLLLVGNYKGAETTFPDNVGLFTRLNNPKLLVNGRANTSLQFTPALSYYEINFELGTDFGTIQNFNHLYARGNDLMTDSVFFFGTNTSNKNWNGCIAEILLFNDLLLNDSLKNDVQQYLADKYNPPANLGQDINLESTFCPPSISPGNFYSSYMWSTGENTKSILAERNGKYWVEVSDIFGRISSDTIEISYPGNFIQDFNLCSGSDSIWDIGLGNTDFFYEWNDMSVNSNILIDSPGEYFVELTDQNNCVYQSDTLDVVIDNFPNSASLGPDVNLCSGNTLELISGQSEAVSYEWNDSSSDPELVVNTSGTYWVEVENTNGCIARDTIDVTIIGQAPTASFVASNFCFGEEVNFTDLSFPPSGESISNWTWNFGDGDDSNDQNPVHTFDDLGTYPVSLTIQTPAGCTDIFETEIQINPLPVADFLVSNLCSDQDAFFDDNSTISSGTINNWSWEFGDSGSANGENVGHTYSEAGNYDVTLTATSDVGCSDMQTLNISINPSPISSFIASSTCLGQPTVFSQNIDTTIAGPAQIYAWDFDNGFTSNFPTTSQTYFVPGSYDVSLSVTSIFGCVDDTIQVININDLPHAGFSNLNACIGESTFFTDTTQIFLTDSIVDWHWNFSNQGASDIANPTFIFNNTGNFNVSLEVVSQAGCEASAQNIITVFEDPNPDFEFVPSIGLPPLEVTFDNLTSDAINFVWNFGNGDSSVDFSPEYTYLDTGIFTIQLLAINENECSDTLTKTILVIEPIFELDLSEIFCEIADDKIYASALISNFGNHDINTFDISLNVGNGARITEVWNGLLRPGESFLYDFVAAPEFSPAVNQEFFCSTVSNPNGNNRELTLENNTVCKALSDDEFILFPPYPNPNKGELNFNYILPIDNLVTLEIIDDLGRIVKYRELEGTLGHNSYQMFIPTLEVGSYLLRLSTTSSSQSQWFFVE